MTGVPRSSTRSGEARRAGSAIKTVIAAMLACVVAPAAAHDRIDPARVRAHVAFLADPTLHGRGSLTPDEATAAAYVAAQFQALGLDRAPGVDGYVQSAPVLRQALAGAPLCWSTASRCPARGC